MKLDAPDGHRRECAAINPHTVETLPQDLIPHTHEVLRHTGQRLSSYTSGKIWALRANQYATHAELPESDT